MLIMPFLLGVWERLVCKPIASSSVYCCKRCLLLASVNVLPLGNPGYTNLAQTLLVRMFSASEGDHDCITSVNGTINVLYDAINCPLHEGVLQSRRMICW